MKKRYVSRTLILKIFIGVLLIVSNFMMIHFAKWNVFIFLWLNTLLNFAGTHILFKDMLQTIKDESKDRIVKKVAKNTFSEYIQWSLFIFLNVLFNLYILNDQTKYFSVFLFNCSLYVALFIGYQILKRKVRYCYTTDGYVLAFCLIQGCIVMKESISSLVGDKFIVLDDSLNKILWLLVISNLCFDVLVYITFYSDCYRIKE